MDEIAATFAKLNGLHSTVSKLVSGRANYFDPLTALEHFNRFANIRDHLVTLLPELYADYPARPVPQSSSTIDNEGRGYITRVQLERLAIDVEEVLEIWSSSRTRELAVLPPKVTREGVFFVGQYFDALMQVKEILSQAKRTISIIDGYVKEDVLKMLSAKDRTVEANLLTKPTAVTPSVEIAVVAFNKQYGLLSLRTSSAFHDRFVVIDDTDFYHFGASIADLGKRGFMFSLIEEPAVIRLLRAEWNSEWKRASVVI